jgi:hypothetical protein
MKDVKPGDWIDLPLLILEEDEIRTQSGVTSNTWVIELGPACPVSPERSSSVMVGAGVQSRVLMTKAQSTPSPRDTASEDAPGVLPERASHPQVPFAGRGPLPHTACK